MIIPREQLNPRLSEVLRYLGYKKGKTQINEEIIELINELLNFSINISEPEYSCRFFDLDSDLNLKIQEESIKTSINIFSGEKIRKHLFGAEKAVLLVVTAGNKIEQEIDLYFQKNEYTKALILDAVGTEIVESAADYAEELIKQQAQEAGYLLTKRFSPGYGDWDLKVQSVLLELANQDRIKVKVNPASMLQPQKSITAVIGLLKTTDNKSVSLIQSSNLNKDWDKCQSCGQPACSYKDGESFD